MRGLRRRLGPVGIDTLLVDIHGEDGVALRERFAFELSPTFIVFDGAGREVWRGNMIPSRSKVFGLVE